MYIIFQIYIFFFYIKKNLRLYFIGGYQRNNGTPYNYLAKKAPQFAKQRLKGAQ